MRPSLFRRMRHDFARWPVWRKAMLVGFFIAGIICIVALTRSSDVENQVNAWDDVALYAGIASGVLFALTLGSPATD